MASTDGAIKEPILAADGTPLKQALRRSQARERRAAFLLVAPLLLFILIVFAVPIASMIWRSVYNPEVRNFLPQTAAALQEWDGEDVPPEPVFQAMAADMIVGVEKRTIGRAAARINREIPGARSRMMRTAREVDEWSAPYREKFLEADERWSDLDFWRLLKRETRLVTPAYYLLALDYEYTADGEIRPRPEVYRIYKALFWRTAWMSMLITGICILLAYPISYLMATQPARVANLLLILVLLPFWTSLLVRTSAWIVLLQQQGVINELLVALDIIDSRGRLRMIYNRTGTIIAMTHILLPFMVLPLYSVMKTIPPSYLRAAKSLGAHPFRAWWRVYFPLTIPGLAAGCILVFILAIGYYITPALVGGDSGIFISNLIAQNMQGSSAQLKLAAALATILLVAVLVVYWVFNKLVGVDKLKFG
ncbi:ABC transporter permease [Chelativorans alearense]|uniref:ABC transporter permease n=1 Tax=Chelativorans alearense TaxID=2681495 RepID=UPI0013D86AB3|nr:ABC transporter permease [Chelativorans alearense]